MAVLLDPPTWPAHGTTWSHLVSDSSLAELHTFAAAAGLPARSFDLDHYDVPASRYAELRGAGALAVDGRTLLRRLRAGGLRRSERERQEEGQRLAEAWEALAAPAVGGGDEAAAAAAAHALGAWQGLGEDLLARWAEKGRIHHGRRHLVEVVAAVDELADAERVPATDRRVALLAAWFHDAVHTSGVRREPVAAGSPAPTSAPAVSDERASADLARSLLTDLVAPEVVDAVERLVLLTEDPRVDPGDVAGALLSDADLAVLGSSPARYADYAAGIRVEYLHVPEEAFRAGRASILESLLTGSLFTGATARERWERAARANLSAEIAALRA